MLSVTKEFLKNNFNISDKVLELSEKALGDIECVFNRIDKIREYNQIKVLKAMQSERLSDTHFTNSTGYGYGDIGRDALEAIYARVFNAEDALVRPNVISGTHAITLALTGNLRPGDTLMYITGAPYDTLLQVIGVEGENLGSLKEFNIDYKEIALKNNKIDVEKVVEELKKDPSIKMVGLQRSTGYDYRPSITIDEIKEATKAVKEAREDVIVFVDNCYGEFVDVLEPTDVGVDLIAGSLIKNIGGGIAPTGGYIVGKREYVTQASYRLTSPGIGKEAGATLGVIRHMIQGLFHAPHVTAEALKTAIFCSRMMELSGYDVCPGSFDKRSDIILAIKFGNEKDLVNFCKGIQKGSPVDSFVECEPWEMPGYTSKVIMAAGAFNQGSSIELSADGPIREPYIAYMQGGLTFDHGKTGVMIGLSNVLNNK
ncbi:aminotransferase class I/II-fold pyridoxal phosphate-dependent enzyme [Clostridium cylindrosporum]|uniref:Cystathionine beta-lyase family protein n=1 Tax=Clostridium cylindrosporum DSM 605 TaxID=1121307 RepID=A0A0J8DFU5_CLOCY|nr:methionine gamma-lyase family protein [Clostridium cylindrosporum]KMT23033.1 cystathionine beta-lyase family protein [Clostridium cylindrosporum DSM 605]